MGVDHHAMALHMMSFIPVRMRGALTVLFALGLAAVGGAFEYATGYDLHLSALFLVPICLAGWMAGRRAGLFLSLVCALAGLVADLMTGHRYEHPVIPYWNALMLLAFFVVIVNSLSAFQAAHNKLLAAQQELKRHNEQLEETVRQRTGALEAEIAERKRLEEENLQAERLAMVGTIAAQVAHEVRNPLGSITLNLDLIAKEIDKFAASSQYSVQEGRTLIGEMREEVRRIQRVIEDYLRFARLPKLRPQTLHLNDFLEQKLAFMDAVFESARVQFRTDFDSDVSTITADPEQLWQAILNLLQNSIEAMPMGGELTVSTRSENGQVVLRVSDSGKGMTAEQVKKVSVPFFTTKPRGTGLGLSLTQQILNEHGAGLECESAVGSGTTFSIRFSSTIST